MKPPHSPPPFVVVSPDLIAAGVQVLRADGVERADDAALENREVTLDGVRMNVSAHVFANLMVHGLMAQNPRLNGAHRALAIGYNVDVLRVLKLLSDDRLKRLAVHGRDMERAHAAVTLYQREHALFAHAATALMQALAGVLVLFLAAYVGRIRLNRAAARAEQAGGVLHGFADTVRHEPRRLIRHTEHALQLLGANALLAGRHELHGLKPYVQRDLGALEDGPDRDRKLAAAVLALEQARTVGLALKAVVIRAYHAAMRAYRTVRPADILKPLAGLGCVFEVGLVKECFFSHGTPR